MKKALILSLVLMFVLTLFGCKKHYADPEPLGEADIYFYDNAHEIVEVNHTSLMEDYVYQTHRGVKPGDKPAIIAEKYILSDFTVESSLMDKGTPATLANISGVAHKDISVDFKVNGTKYSLVFTTENDTIQVITLYSSKE